MARAGCSERRGIIGHAKVRHTDRVNENWALAVSFHEAFEGAQIQPIGNH